MANQTILITGATSGLGRELCLQLAAKGARVLVHGRDPQRLQSTVSEVREAAGSDQVGSYLADLSSLDQVRQLAQQVLAAEERLDVLVNNAGVGFGPPGQDRQLSQDGYELRLAVDYLAPFLLTRLVLPLLVGSAPARIVNVTSMGQAPIDFEDVMFERHYDGTLAYRRAKLALVMFTFDLAEELAGTGVTVNCLHPATFMPTRMLSEAGGSPISTLAEGVAPTMRLIVDPGLDGVTGRYFDQDRDARANDQAYDRSARDRLRRLSETLIGLEPVGGLR